MFHSKQSSSVSKILQMDVHNNVRYSFLWISDLWGVELNKAFMLFGMINLSSKNNHSHNCVICQADPRQSFWIAVSINFLCIDTHLQSIIPRNWNLVLKCFILKVTFKKKISSSFSIRFKVWWESSRGEDSFSYFW